MDIQTNPEPWENSLFERRYFSAAEVRLKDDDESNAITGYAAVFDKWSEDLGWFKEKIEPGAFARTIKNADVRALINHDPNLIIGRTRNSTLRLWEDDKGLGYEVDLPETTYANDLRESISRRDITQNSFGFQTVEDEWSEDGKRRTLIEVKLFDISPVTFPAYKQTNVKIRLQKMGIDYDGLGAALLRSACGVIMNSDIELLRSTIQILSASMPDIADPLAVVGDPGHSSDDDPSAVVNDPEHLAPAEDPDFVSTWIREALVTEASKKHFTRRVF